MIQLLLLYHTNVNNSGTRRIKFFNFFSRKWEISKIYQIIFTSLKLLFFFSLIFSFHPLNSLFFFLISLILNLSDSSVNKLTIEKKKREKRKIVDPPSKHLGTITTDPQLFVLCDDNATRKMVSLAGYSTTVRKHKSITRRTGSSTGYVPRNFTISFIARGFTRHNFVVLVFLVDMMWNNAQRKFGREIEKRTFQPFFEKKKKITLFLFFFLPLRIVIVVCEWVWQGNCSK